MTPEQKQKYIDILDVASFFGYPILIGLAFYFLGIFGLITATILFGFPWFGLICRLGTKE